MLPKTPALNRQLISLFQEVDKLLEEPLAPLGLERLRLTSASLRPTTAFLAPVQATCNYATLFFRNAASLLSEGDANGTYQRFSILAAPSGPNNEGSPSNAPANGPGRANYLHRNGLPNTASPGQTKECEAGNERYVAGQRVLGSAPGNGGVVTDGQRGLNAPPGGGE